MTKKCNPTKITNRLHRIEGQVRSIEKMYNEKRDIKEIVSVVMAARASLDSVTRLLVADKVNGCYDKQKIVKREQLEKLISVLFHTT